MKKILAELKCVLKAQALLGESPLWCPEKQCLYWVDILDGQLFKFDPRTGKNQELLKLSQEITAVGLCQGDFLILALKKGIARFNLRDRSLTRLADLEQDQPQNRLNDGKCDRQGRFWCGTMNQVDPKKATGNLYRFDSRRAVTRMQGEVKLTNGMGWSPDNRLMYFTETMRYTIFVYDFKKETGELSNRRPFIQLAPFPIGGPDGLTVDEEGYLWSAHYGEGRIVRYDPEGKVDRWVELPVPHVTSCMFGGEELETLYITTAQEHLTPQQLQRYPLSGSLFAIEPGMRGLPEGHYKL